MFLFFRDYKYIYEKNCKNPLFFAKIFLIYSREIFLFYKGKRGKIFPVRFFSGKVSERPKNSVKTTEVLMKILLILTGGTIACKVDNHRIDVSEETASDILIRYQTLYPCTDITFNVVQPLQTLSENHTSVTYNRLIDFLYQYDFHSYDGVIMTHGSDTLSYTSALIGMLFGHLPIPFMITASDYPLSEENSNGISNFYACVRWIEERLCNGVFTVYGKKDFPNIYLATRVCEANPITDEFSAFADGMVCQFHYHKISYINNELVSLLKNRPNDIICFSKPPVIKNDVLLIKTYPNQNFDCYALENVSAVLIYLYHSGTACTVGNSKNICRFMEKCWKKQIPVYTASHKPKQDRYVTSIETDRYTTFKLYGISMECAYSKLLLALNQDEYISEKILGSDIFFENCLL